MFFKKKKKPSQELIDSAEKLQGLLQRYAIKENEAKTCLKALAPLIDGVLNGNVKLPVGIWV